MISIFQIYFDKKTEQYLDRESFIPFLKDWEDDYFENSVIARIYNEQEKISGSEYVGVTSWKQSSPENKNHFTGQEIIEHIKKDIANGNNKDVYIYSPIQNFEKINSINGIIHGIIKDQNIWERHKAWGIHPDKENVMLNDSGILPFDLFDGKYLPCDCNYWIARKDIFNEYCKNVLIPAINFFENLEIKNKMPKWYQHRHTGKKYNSCCFTMEGLFGSFLAHSNYTVHYFCKQRLKRPRGKFEIVEIL